MSTWRRRKNDTVIGIAPCWFHGTHINFSKRFSAFCHQCPWSFVVKMPCRQTLTIVSHSNRYVFFLNIQMMDVAGSFYHACFETCSVGSSDNAQTFTVHREKKQLLVHVHTLCVRGLISLCVLFVWNKCPRSFSTIEKWVERRTKTLK